ncbi:hypothetical protein RIF29_08952 [Crotalaria pallida]|uniref:Uncharacterized protein n=1 Tax=Crotalaria pallida TaxID=3830 RepID=A0AAN9FXM2_CROPI
MELGNQSKLKAKIKKATEPLEVSTKLRKLEENIILVNIYTLTYMILTGVNFKCYNYLTQEQRLLKLSFAKQA